MFWICRSGACAACSGSIARRKRKVPQGREDEARLTEDIIELAGQYGRYGTRRIAELLRRAGWLVNDKRVERIWRREGRRVPARQPKRGRLWLNDGSCVRLRAERPIPKSGRTISWRIVLMTGASTAC